MGLFGSLLKGVGSILKAPFKAAKGVLTVPTSLLRSVGGLAKGVLPQLKGLLKQALPLAAAAAPILMPGVGSLAGPLMGMLSGGGAGTPAATQETLLSQYIPNIVSQLKGGSAVNPAALVQALRGGGPIIPGLGV